MSPDSPIEYDVPCHQCRYNLRGVTVVHRCPECGFPALRSVIREKLPRRRFGVSEGIVELRFRRVAFALLPELLGCPAAAVKFVAGVSNRQAALRARHRGSKMPVHKNARDFCSMIAGDAVAHFGGPDAAASKFREWGFVEGKDVGRVVAALVEAGLMLASESDDPADFVPIGPIAALPEFNAQA